MLTKEEQKEFDKLKVGFNIIPAEEDYNYNASLRVEISRPVAKRILKISFYLNCISLICFVLSLLITFLKPMPSFSGSTPNGKIYPLKTIKLPKGK